MKKLIDLGCIIATLLMFSPLYIILNYKNIDNYFLWLVITILYDIYHYSIIKKQQDMNRNKKLFEDIIKGNTVSSKTEEEKLQWYKTLCISMFLEESNHKTKK